MRSILRKFHISHLVVVWSVAVILAMVLSGFWGGLGGDALKRMVGVEAKISGVVMEDAESDGSELALRLSSVEVEGQKVDGIIYVKLSTSERIERSDRLTLSGKLYDGFGVFAVSMWRPYLEKIEKPNPPDIALAARDWFGERVRQFIAAPEVDLALGYLLGQKKALPEDLSELLGEVGLTHIVVASGYNLSILIGGTRRIFRRVSRAAALLFGALLVVCFMGVVGFSASMVRAGIVTLLGLLAWYAGRRFHPVKLLLLVAAVTLLMNPIYIMDLGWLLSFASFAGVMIVAPILLRYFYGASKPNFLAAVFVETMAAQICCLPIVMYFSGSFSLVSVLANVLILPTIPLVMALTFATGALAFLSLIAAICDGVANVVLTYHIGVVEFFGAMRWAIFEIEANNPAVFLAYLVIFLVVYYMKRKTKFRLIDCNVLE
ncbi:MAG: ComEC/Rec2 family competence protein [Candidatus Saccharimonadales bacterium]